MRSSSTPAGNDQLTVSTAVVSLAAVPDKSNYALITCSGAAVRFTDDGTDPTSSTGHPLEAGDHLEYNNRADRLKFIRRDGADATLDVTYWK